MPNLDNLDVVEAVMYVKDHSYRDSNGFNKTAVVPLDWGASQVGDFVMLGSPYQIFAPEFAALGNSSAIPDTHVRVSFEKLPNSGPFDDLTSAQTSAESALRVSPAGTLHYKSPNI